MKALIHSSNDPCKRPFFVRDEKLLPDRVWFDVWIPENENHAVGALYTPAFFCGTDHYVMHGYYLLCGKKGMGTVLFGVN